MECYCAAARRASRRLVRMYEEELRPAGVNPAQFELLQYLSRMPEPNQNELAEAVDVDQTTLSRNLKGMIALGWVVASQQAQDRRVSTYALTKSGATVMRAAASLWRRAQAKISKSLGDGNSVRSSLELLSKAAS
jgi:DNA-binding MarR family transcriptional regulator